MHLALLSALMIVSAGWPAGTAPRNFDEACRAAMPAYYAALATSARGDGDGTTRHLLVLSTHWKELAARTDAPAWAKDTAGGRTVLAAVQWRIDAARQRTLARDVQAAHVQLEAIRAILREARSRHGVRTFDDAVTDYHEAMERLASRVGLHNEITLTAEDYVAIQEQSVRARNAWAGVESGAGPVRSLSGWSTTASDTSTLLTALQKAAFARDLDATQTAAESLKARYFDLLGVLSRG